jgi:hypothetical protein
VYLYTLLTKNPYKIHLDLHKGNTEYTQKNGAVSIVFTIETAPLFCVYSVYEYIAPDTNNKTEAFSREMKIKAGIVARGLPTRS